jgi:peptide/nickel transport system permease protein
MTAFLLRRVALIVPTLFFVSVLIFGLQQLLPGDPALALAGENQDPAVIAYLHQKYHLDQPLPVRYVLWVQGVLQGDLGESIRIKRPVFDLICEKLPVTGELALLALVVALVIGVPAGIIAAVKHNTAVDYGASIAALWGLSIPNFWLGILLILLFSVELGLLPASGFVGPGDSLKQNLLTLVMPAFVLGNAIAAVMMRHTRSAMLQVLSSDYVRTARAKRLGELRVILRHALRNALVPVVTLGFAQDRLPAQKVNILLKNSRKPDLRRVADGHNLLRVKPIRIGGLLGYPMRIGMIILGRETPRFFRPTGSG